MQAGRTPRACALAYLKGGARVLQVRAKRLAAGQALELIDAVVRAAAPHGAAVVVNDRVDLARLAGAAGVHVGQDDLPPRLAREQLGPQAIVGVSTHTVAQVEAAAREPVDYIAVGPVFGTTTKDAGYDAVGLELVTIARRLVPAHIPIVAIGGITLDRAPAVWRAGASTVAVIGDLLTGDPEARVRAYLDLFARMGKV